MLLTFYAREYYIRGTQRYVCMSLILLLLIWLTLWSGSFFSVAGGGLPGWQSWLSVVMLVFCAWLYRKFMIHQHPEQIQGEVQTAWLSLGTQFYPWTSLVWFAVEYEANTWDLYNLILCLPEHRIVHTFADSQEHIVAFLQELQQYTAWLEKVPYAPREIIMRRCKI